MREATPSRRLCIVPQLLHLLLRRREHTAYTAHSRALRVLLRALPPLTAHHPPLPLLLLWVPRTEIFSQLWTDGLSSVDAAALVSLLQMGPCRPQWLQTAAALAVLHWQVPSVSAAHSRAPRVPLRALPPLTAHHPPQPLLHPWVPRTETSSQHWIDGRSSAGAAARGSLS